MKEGDNAEREENKACSSVSLLFGRKGRAWHAGLSDLSAQVARGGKGTAIHSNTPCWGWLGEGEGKQRENETLVFDREPARLLSKWKCGPLLMEVYLLPIVSRASPVKGSFDGSVFVHRL